MIKQTTRTGDDDLHAIAQFLNLVAHAHATIDGHTPQARMMTQFTDVSVNLFGEFARGCDDQDAHMTARSPKQTLQDGQDKGGGLAGAGLCQPHYIAPFQNWRDRLMLNGRGIAVVHRPNARHDARVKLKCFKRH